MGELRGQLAAMAEQLERERTRGDTAAEQVRELTGHIGELTGKLEAMQDELAARRTADAAVADARRQAPTQPSPMPPHGRGWLSRLVGWIEGARSGS